MAKANDSDIALSIIVSVTTMVSGQRGESGGSGVMARGWRHVALAAMCINQYQAGVGPYRHFAVAIGNETRRQAK